MNWSTTKTALFAATVVAWVGCSPALAAPKGEFAVFGDCPLGVLEVQGCIYASMQSGEFVIGGRWLPITSPVVLRVGFIENEATGEQSVVGAVDGNTLSKGTQAIPGGLAGLIAAAVLPRSLRARFAEIAHGTGGGVTATIELAAPAGSIGLSDGNFLQEQGTAVSLPVKLHLTNSFLGGSCYIGSNASPVILALTTGLTSPPPPNKPIAGRTGKITVVGEGSILALRGGSLVNDSFAVPKATGCGGSVSSLVDPALDAALGLPSAAGHNTVILDSALEQAGSARVAEEE